MEAWIKDIYFYILKKKHSINDLAINYPSGKPIGICIINPVNTIQKHIEMIR